jgi:hypothetical protein
MRGVLVSKLSGAGIVGASTLAFVASASAAVIGPQKLTNTDGASTCIDATCTIAAPKIPGEKTQAPFRGKITRWKVNIPAPHDSFNNDGPLRLQVLKRTTDEPGWGNDGFVAVRESDEETATPDSVNSFATNLRIRKGQFIGVTSTDDTEIYERSKNDSRYLYWGGALLPADPARPPDFTDDDRFNLFNAKVKK